MEIKIEENDDHLNFSKCSNPNPHHFGNLNVSTNQIIRLLYYDEMRGMVMAYLGRNDHSISNGWIPVQFLKTPNNKTLIFGGVNNHVLNIIRVPNSSLNIPNDLPF